MNIVVFGATGRTGHMIVKYGLERGHALTAFVRDKTKLDINNPGLQIVQGDVLDAATVAHALGGHDAVLAALKLNDVSDRVAGYDNIIAGMKQQNIHRIIAIGGSGCLQVDEHTRYHETPQFPESFRKVSLAHWEVCKRLDASGLDWTFVCPPEIPNGEKTGRYIAKATYRPGGRNIVTGDLADFMLNELAANEYVKMRVGICNI